MINVMCIFAASLTINVHRLLISCGHVFTKFLKFYFIWARQINMFHAAICVLMNILFL